MIDLFIQADNNKKPLSVACKNKVTKLAKKQRKLAKKFKRWVKENAQISINLSPFVVSLMLEDAPYQNIHEVARRFAESTGESVDEVLRLFLKDKYDQRMDFSKKIAHEESFRYGALNGGCTGVIWYGTIRGVLKQDFVAGLENCVCLPDDSLAMCHATGQFDPTDVCKQVAPYSNRHLLAASDRLTELPNIDSKKWSELLISGLQNPEKPAENPKQRYFEVVFIGEVSLGSFEFFRLSDVYQDDYIHLTSALSKATLFRWTEEQQKLLDCFQLMLKKHIIHLKPTEELALIYYFKHWLKNARTDDEMLDSLRHLPNIQCTEARQWLEEFLEMRNSDADKVAHEQLAQADDYMRINQAMKDKKIEVL